MLMNNLKILATGGTIDDLEYDDEHSAPAQRISLIPMFAEEFSPELKNATTVLFQKDSTFINSDDREIIAAAIVEAHHEKIIVTHGTKTMAQTAKYLGPKVPKGKTIVLTGCMTLPRADKGKDAKESLAYAIAMVQTLSPGVYVAMQNQIFPWNNVMKNVEEGRFEFERGE